MRDSFLPREQGTSIDGYRLLEELGAGGMGVVYKAFDPRKNQFIAIKMIGQALQIRNTIHGGDGGNNQFDARYRMMLVREASLSARLQHPNILRVFDYGQFCGLLYIAMEYLEGRSLDRVIADDSGLGLDEKLTIGAQLLDALAFAHDHGIIHRDVKPPNTFLCSSGLVKVLDFGLVATFSQIAQGRVIRGGTLRYMAPEVLTGRSDHRADIWAAGATIYELITGRCPFSGLTTSETLHNILNMPCPTLPASIPHSLRLHAMLGKALHKNPSHRYAHASEFARHLRELLTSDSSPSPLAIELNVPRAPDSALTVTGDVDLLAKRCGGNVVLESRINRTSGIVGFLDRLEYFPVVRSWFFTTSLAGLILGGLNFNTQVAVWVFGVNFALMGAVYLLIGGPKLALVPLGMVEFWSTIPRCPDCARRMRTVDQITRFAFGPVEIQFALLDCVSALEENLWEDAIKLFSIHTHEFAPTITNTVADAPLRYHLGLFECQPCCQRCAQLITDEKDGYRWTSRPEYVRAHGASPFAYAPLSFFRRTMASFQTFGQAALAGFSRTTFPRALLIGLVAVAVFFAVGWLVLVLINRRLFP